MVVCFLVSVGMQVTYLGFRMSGNWDGSMAVRQEAKTKPKMYGRYEASYHGSQLGSVMLGNSGANV